MSIRPRKLIGASDKFAAYAEEDRVSRKAALGIAAMSVSRSKGTYLAVTYRRIAARRGPINAVVAIERAVLTGACHMLRNGEAYTDPGADYYTRLDPQKAANKAI